jgi:Fe-Mn family superoxide dismutase
LVVNQNAHFNHPESQMAFELPPLPYRYDALEPYIDKATMRLHHDRHHQAYVINANNALQDTGWADAPVAEVLQNLDQLPDDRRSAVRNNAGGHYNHSLFWRWMSPDGGGEPDGALREALDATFGSVRQFKATFKAAAVGQFGSGWAWLVHDGSGLGVVSTPNQDSPISDGETALLGIDIWEHAYYLNYQNRRPDYIDAWWNVVNWPKVEQSYAAMSDALSLGRCG